MKSNELAFLALVALQKYSVDLDTGHVFINSKRGTPLITPCRTDALHTDGYRIVQFRPDSRGCLKVYAHRIVWACFNRQLIKADMVINHIDGDKGNNRPSNLEEVTRSENDKHRLYVLKKSVPRLENGRFHRPEALYG